MYISLSCRLYIVSMICKYYNQSVQGSPFSNQYDGMKYFVMIYIYILGVEWMPQKFHQSLISAVLITILVSHFLSVDSGYTNCKHKIP